MKMSSANGPSARNASVGPASTAPIAQPTGRARAERHGASAAPRRPGSRAGGIRAAIRSAAEPGAGCALS